MTTQYTPTGSSNEVTIPAYSDTADIVQAFKDYHDDVSVFLDAKAPKASPVFSGTVTFASGASITLPTGSVGSGQIADGAIVDADISSSASISQSKIANLASDLALKAPLAAPALTGNATAVNLQVTGTLSGTLSGTATNATNGAIYGSGFSKVTVLAGATGPANPNTGDVWISF